MPLLAFPTQSSVAKSEGLHELVKVSSNSEGCGSIGQLTLIASPPNLIHDLLIRHANLIELRSMEERRGGLRNRADDSRYDVRGIDQRAVRGVL